MKVKDFFLIRDFGLLRGLNQRDTSDESWHAAESNSIVCRQKAAELMQHPMLLHRDEKKIMFVTTFKIWRTRR